MKGLFVLWVTVRNAVEFAAVPSRSVVEGGLKLMIDRPVLGVTLIPWLETSFHG